MILNFNFQDLSQIFIGSFALAVPISFSEEAWRLGEQLPIYNIALLFLLSISFLALYTYESVFQGEIKYRVAVYVLRIIFAYLIASMVVALILLSLDKFPLFTEPLIAFKRLIIITMPASMGAIIVDGFDKE